MKLRIGFIINDHSLIVKPHLKNSSFVNIVILFPNGKNSQLIKNNFMQKNAHGIIMMVKEDVPIYYNF